MKWHPGRVQPCVQPCWRKVQKAKSDDTLPFDYGPAIVVGDRYPMKNDFPQTVQTAVAVLLQNIALEEQVKIPRMCSEGLFMLQFTVGAWIRRQMGLYDGNQQPIENSGETDIDLVSMVVIRALWTHLCIHGAVSDLAPSSGVFSKALVTPVRL